MPTNNEDLGKTSRPGWSFTFRENDAPSPVRPVASEITRASSLWQSAEADNGASDADRKELAKLLAEWRDQGITPDQIAVALRVPLATVRHMPETVPAEDD